jgi:hypothetical protein
LLSSHFEKKYIDVNPVRIATGYVLSIFPNPLVKGINPAITAENKAGTGPSSRFTSLNSARIIRMKAIRVMNRIVMVLNPNILYRTAATYGTKGNSMAVTLGGSAGHVIMGLKRLNPFVR